MDLIVKNATLRKRQGLFDIGIEQGKICKIEEKIEAHGCETIEAGGNLVTESFCNAHLHLCKVYTLFMMDEMALQSYHGADMGAAMTAIELAARVKEKYDASWILENVRKALRLAAWYGNTHIRAFADVDSKAKLEGIKALLQAKEEFKGIVDIQVVAFPQDGVVREPGSIELVEEAMKMGADVVGGIPWIEFTEEDEHQHINIMMKIAQKYGADVSMLVDDAGDASLKTLEMLAVKTIQMDWFGRTLAHHARAMALYPTPYFKKISALLKKAQMGVVSDPHTGPLHAKVKELLEEGNLVILGQDDILDAYYPFGRNNMLEVAFLATHLLWMTRFSEMEKLYDMITIDAARAMNVKNFGIQVGNHAHLVVLDAKTTHEAILSHKEPLHVVSHGKLVKRERPQSM